MTRGSDRILWSWKGSSSGLALALTLFVVAASLALAAAETRDERDVLSVVGAAPTMLRRASAHKAWLLSFLGAVLGIPVGFLPVVVFTRADPITSRSCSHGGSSCSLWSWSQQRPPSSRRWPAGSPAPPTRHHLDHGLRNSRLGESGEDTESIRRSVMPAAPGSHSAG